MDIKGFNTELQDLDDRYQWVNEMVKSRQDLVVSYLRLLNLDPNIEFSDLDEHYEAPKIDELCSSKPCPSLSKVVSFCEQLIDYISHGHFDLYPKIVKLIEVHKGRSLSIAHRVMPKIEKTTEILLQFNDKYAENESGIDLNHLREDLANIGPCLELRFRNEDRLIIGLKLLNSLHKANK